jgi:hypothetical protein
MVLACEPLQWRLEGASRADEQVAFFQTQRRVWVQQRATGLQTDERAQLGGRGQHLVVRTRHGGQASPGVDLPQHLAEHHVHHLAGIGPPADDGYVPCVRKGPRAGVVDGIHDHDGTKVLLGLQHLAPAPGAGMVAVRDHGDERRVGHPLLDLGLEATPIREVAGVEPGLEGLLGADMACDRADDVRSAEVRLRVGEEQRDRRGVVRGAPRIEQGHQRERDATEDLRVAALDVVEPMGAEERGPVEAVVDRVRRLRELDGQESERRCSLAGGAQCHGVVAPGSAVGTAFVRGHSEVVVREEHDEGSLTRREIGQRGRPRMSQPERKDRVDAGARCARVSPPRLADTFRMRRREFAGWMEDEAHVDRR